jgi:Prophage tail length tape measure protein/D-alanyl-D-alanine carboxypeptidase
MVTSTAIRLGTTGGNEVKSDLQSIGATGTKAYDDVAIAAERSARRAQKAYDQATKDVDEARARQARSSATLAAFTPQTNVQAAVQAGVSTGFDQYGNSARAAATAIKELVAEQAAFERRAKLIREMLDPAAAAQARYTQEVRATKDVLRAGAISVEDYIARIKQLQAAQRGVDGAMINTTRVSGNAKQGMQQLSYQIADVGQSFATGINPMVIFAQQGSQVVQAIAMMQDEAKGLIGFMAGPWGAALLAATTVAALLIPKLLDNGEALKKAREEADKFRQAVLALSDAQNKALFSEEQLSRQVAITAENYRLAVESARRRIAMQVEEARVAAADAIIRQRGGGRGAAESAVVDGPLIERLKYLEGVLREIDVLRGKATSGAGAAISNYISGIAARRSTPEGAITARYENLISTAKQEGARTRNFAREAQEVARLTQARDAEIAAVQKSNTSLLENGRFLSSREARGIAENAGFQVNSSDRSFAQQKRLYDQWVAAGRPSDNPVAKPGSSAHERGNALDIQFGAGVNPATLRKLYADQGVQLTKVFKERRHYHIEWAKDVAAAKGLADALRDAAAAQREMDAAFDDVIRKLDPLTAAANDYAALLDKIALSQKGGRFTEGRAEELKAAAAVAQFRPSLNNAPDLISTEQINQNLERLDGLRKPIDEVKGAFADLEAVGMSALDALLDPRDWQDFGETAKRVIREIILELIKLELQKAAVSLISTVFHTPGHATGTSYSPAGLSLVGEQGRELVDLPRGSRVYSASDTRRMLSGGNDNSAKFNFQWSIDATGADAAGLARVENQLRRLEQSVPSMAVAAVTDARQRRSGG